MDDVDWLEVRWKRLLRAWKKDSFALTIAVAREILARSPEFAPAWTCLGLALTELAHYEEAERSLMKALELASPNYVRGRLLELGEHFAARGRIDLAEGWYRKSIEAAPGDADGYFCLGGLLARQGRFDEAEDAHRTATMCSEGCIDVAYYNLGLVLRAKGRFEEAETCFQHALRLDPKYRGAKRALRDVQRTMIYQRELVEGPADELRE